MTLHHRVPSLALIVWIINPSLSLRASEVIQNIRKQSTRLSYSCKWHRFCQWLPQASGHPMSIGLPAILDFLLSLKDEGLSHASIRVYLTAILAYYIWVSPFSYPLAKRFLKGLLYLYPPVKRHAELWDLPLVLRCLTRHPFEPAATCDTRLLSLMTLFLVTITSARQVSELTALDLRPPFFDLFASCSQIVNQCVLIEVGVRIPYAQGHCLTWFLPRTSESNWKLLNTQGSEILFAQNPIS